MGNLVAVFVVNDPILARLINQRKFPVANAGKQTGGTRQVAVNRQLRLSGLCINDVNPAGLLYLQLPASPVELGRVVAENSQALRAVFFQQHWRIAVITVPTGITHARAFLL